MDASELIGLDVGQARTGLARASSVAKLAEPLYSVPTAEVLAKLKKLTGDKSVSAIVVGLPIGLNGQETEQTKWVRTFIDSIKPELAVEFYWQDEALSTVTAETQKRASKQPGDIDALAAAIILQDFIDSDNFKGHTG